MRVGPGPIVRKCKHMRRNISYYRHTGDDVREGMALRFVIGTEAYLADSAEDGVGTMLARWSAAALVYIARAASGVPVGAAASAEALASCGAWCHLDAASPASPASVSVPASATAAAAASSAASRESPTGGAESAEVQSVAGLRGVALQAPLLQRDVWESLVRGDAPKGMDAAALRGAASLASRMLLPEWLAQDAADVASSVADLAADAFDNLVGGDKAAESLLEALTVLMAAAHRFSSPHMPAKLAEVAMRLFLPAERHSDHREQPQGAPSKPHSRRCQAALERSRFACAHLPHALMSLYGEVERTGPQEKLEHRSHIMAVLHHLWTLPPYRESLLHTARGVLPTPSHAADADNGANAAAALAGVSAARATDEVLSPAEMLGKFAHGIVTQTTSLLEDALSAIESLVAVRRRLEAQASHVAATGSSEGGPMTDEQFTEARTAQQTHSNEAQHFLRLADQSVAMMRLLAKAAPAALLQGKVGTRLATILLKLLYNLAGGRASSIVLDEATRIAIGFAPKRLLAQLVQTVAALGSQIAFLEGSVDSDMANKADLDRVQSLVARKDILDGDTETQAAFARYCNKLEELAVEAKMDQSKLGDAPECLLDSLTYERLSEPMRLPSGNVVSRSTVVDCLRERQQDPFSRQPMAMTDVTPLPRLGELVLMWARARMTGDDAAAAAAVASAEAFRAEEGCI